MADGMVVTSAVPDITETPLRPKVVPSAWLRELRSRVIIFLQVSQPMSWLIVLLHT